jgi:hypothetical protein
MKIKTIPKEHRELFVKRAVKDGFKYIATIDGIPKLIKDDKELEELDNLRGDNVALYNTYDRYCKFNKDISEDNKLIWKKNDKYKVAFEDEVFYYFGQPIILNGIFKSEQGSSFTITDR